MLGGLHLGLPASFLLSKPLLGPLLARDTSGSAFGALGDPETCVLAHVLLSRASSCASCPMHDATLPLVCGRFAVCLGGCA